MSSIPTCFNCGGEVAANPHLHTCAKAINDGGPAFPGDYTGESALGAEITIDCAGMSLRDWFAGMALSEVTRSTFKASEHWHKLGAELGPRLDP